MEVLTWKEREVYKYLLLFKQINGFAPNITEISKAVGTSRSYAREILYKLSEKGFIRYKGEYRGIVILKFITETA